jgi:hypothetical protein
MPKGIIGQSTKKNANCVLPSYTTRRYSRTLRQWKTVRFALRRLQIITCITLPPATISSVPIIYDFAMANEEFAQTTMEELYPLLRAGRLFVKDVCNPFASLEGNCPFCKSERWNQITGYISHRRREN